MHGGGARPGGIVRRGASGRTRIKEAGARSVSKGNWLTVPHQEVSLLLTAEHDARQTGLAGLLIVMYGSRTWRVRPGKPFTFGRDPACSAVLPAMDRGVSRNAGSFTHHDGSWWVHNDSASSVLCMLGDRGFRVDLPPGLGVPLQQWHAKVILNGTLGSYTLRLRLPDLDDLPDPAEEVPVPYVTGERAVTSTRHRAPLTSSDRLVLAARFDFLNGARGGLQYAETRVETVLGVGLHQVEHGLLLAALRRVNLDLAVALFRKQLFQRLAIFEIHGNVNDRGHVAFVEIDLLQQRGKELRLVVLLLILPEVFAAVHDLAIAQVEDIQRHQRRLGVDGENIDIVALGRGHLLALVEFLHGGQQVAQRAGFFEPRGLRRGFHTGAQFGGKVGVPALQEQAHIAHCAAIRVIGGQPFHAGPQAAMDVVLQTRLGMVARQVHLARRHQKMA